MGLKKPPRGSQRDLCQLLKVFNSFPSEQPGFMAALPSYPSLLPSQGSREPRSFCLHQNPAPSLGAEPDPPQIPAGKALNAKPPPGVGCCVPSRGNQRERLAKFGWKTPGFRGASGKKGHGCQGEFTNPSCPPGKAPCPSIPRSQSASPGWGWQGNHHCCWKEGGNRASTNSIYISLILF